MTRGGKQRHYKAKGRLRPGKAYQAFKREQLRSGLYSTSDGKWTNSSNRLTVKIAEVEQKGVHTRLKQN